MCEECTDFDLAITDSLMQQDVGGASDSTPSVYIMRLLPSTTGMAGETDVDEDYVAMIFNLEARKETIDRAGGHLY